MGEGEPGHNVAHAGAHPGDKTGAVAAALVAAGAFSVDTPQPLIDTVSDTTTVVAAGVTARVAEAALKLAGDVA